MKIDIRLETWPLKRPFRITGQEITECRMLIVEIGADGAVGRGEAVGVSYRGETPETLLSDAQNFARSHSARLDRRSLQTLLGSGGVRNAFDCALWELDARRENTTVWRLAGLDAPRPVTTAYTIGADAPEEMAQQARDFADATAIKLKLNGEAAVDRERIAAVRAARPDVWLGVDANRGYTLESFALVRDAVIDADVRQVEQPFALGREDDMGKIDGPYDVVADESAQDIDDLATLAGRCSMVNIKLDKTGGLTHAFKMAARARDMGFKVMVGNMVGTAWSQAPGFLLGQSCDIVDLDGALFLQDDRIPGAVYANGQIWCGEDVWGGPHE